MSWRNFSFLLFLLAMCGCAASKQTHELVFRHTFAGKPFALHTPFVTPLGDTVMFTKLKYYVSNIQPSEEKNNYYLVDFEELTNTEASLAYPARERKEGEKLTFGIGIDSIRNSRGEQKGVLDPLRGMFWTWEQGYVFLKAEGYFSPNSSRKVSFVLHVGKNENYLPLAYTGKARKQTVEVRVEKLFGGFAGAEIDLRLPEKPLSIMAGERARQLKRNLQEMFAKSL